MRVYVVRENGKLRITDKITDEMLFQGRVIASKDYEEEDACLPFVLVCKNKRYTILSFNEFKMMFGEISKEQLIDLNFEEFDIQLI